MAIQRAPASMGAGRYLSISVPSPGSAGDVAAPGPESAVRFESGGVMSSSGNDRPVGVGSRLGRNAFVYDSSVSQLAAIVIAPGP